MSLGTVEEQHPVTALVRKRRGKKQETPPTRQQLMAAKWKDRDREDTSRADALTRGRKRTG